MLVPRRHSPPQALQGVHAETETRGRKDTRMKYKVLSKHSEHDKRDDSLILTLVLEGRGELVVSGRTWDDAEVGGEVELPE